MFMVISLFPYVVLMIIMHSATNNIMFIMIANHAYFPPMCLVKFFCPDTRIHIADITAIVNVDAMAFNPKNSPDSKITTINDVIVLMRPDTIHSVNFVYHDDFMCTLRDGDFSLSGNKYPGTHTNEKHIGIVHMICHDFNPIARPRRNLAYTFDKNSPHKYR